MKKQNITYEPTYRGLSTSQFQGVGYCWHTEILQAIHQQMFLACNEVKTLFTRFDIHFPKILTYTNTNQIISAFIDLFRKALKSKFDIKNLRYVWVCEKKATAPNPHYHFIILNNFNRCWSYKQILEVADRCWSSILGRGVNSGLVHHCDKDKFGNLVENGIDITQRNFYGEGFTKSFQRGAYLAKGITKDFKLSGRKWGQSNLTPVDRYNYQQYLAQQQVFVNH